MNYFLLEEFSHQQLWKSPGQTFSAKDIPIRTPDSPEHYQVSEKFAAFANHSNTVYPIWSTSALYLAKWALCIHWQTFSLKNALVLKFETFRGVIKSSE